MATTSWAWPIRSRRTCPDTVFVAPNAPERSAMNPMGYQWFPIPWIDGSSEEQSEAGMARAVEDLNAFLDSVMAGEGVTPAQTILVGFSQGTMMSLHVAPRRAEAMAGVVGFSGRLLAPEVLAEEVVVRPPVLLIHGDQDEVVPPQSLPEAAEACRARVGGGLCPCHEGHGPRDRARRPVGGAGLHARQARDGLRLRWPRVSARRIPPNCLRGRGHRATGRRSASGNPNRSARRPGPAGRGSR
jgi:predicted esterase